jgi:WD40 repeat protein
MGGLYDVAFSKTQTNIIAAASSDKFVYIWNFDKNKLLKKLGGHTDEVNGVTFHPSQAVICSSSDDAQAIIWDYHEGIKLRNLTEHTKAVYGASFAGPDMEYFVATCSFDQKVRMFDMRTKSIVETFQAHTDDVIGIDFCDRKRVLATGSDDGCICVWDMRKNLKWGPPLFKIDTRELPGMSDNEVKRVTFNPDGTKLASGNSSQHVLVYDLSGPSPEIFGILDGRAPHRDCVFDCCFGVDSNGVEFIVDASHDQMSYVWRPQR